MTRYRREIDGLRALAVVSVILFHAGVPHFQGGFIGVDVFFVISGYLITGNMESRIARQQFSFFSFYERRVRRILPALYLVTMACLPFAWSWLFPREFIDFGRALVALCLCGANIFYNDHINYFTGDTQALPLIHTWSLAVEEQFYFGFPLLWLLARRANRKLFLALLVGLIAASLGWAEIDSRVDPQSDFYLLPSRAWEFAIGAAIAIVPPGGGPVFDGPSREALAWSGLGALLYATFAYPPNLPPSLWSLLPVGGAALQIAFATQNTLCGRFLGSPPLVGIGLISYSAYLWHQPLFAFARFRFDVAPASTGMFALTVASFALAYASWRFVELPGRQGRGFSRVGVFTSAVVMSAALVITGRAIVLEHGFPARLPPIEFERDVGAYRDSCLDIADLTPTRLATMSACQLGDRLAPLDFLLIGDSHAAALADGIDVAARRRGRHGLLLAANACLPVSGLESEFPRSRGACRRLHASLDAIVDGLHIKLVLLHARWEALGDAEVLPDAERATEPPEKALARRLEDTIADFAARGAKVIIITGTPVAPYRVPDILMRKALFRLDVEERPRLATFLKQNELATRLFQSPGLRARALIFDIYPFFCPPGDNGLCEVADHGHPYFWDDNHLSSFGSVALAPREEDLFR